MFLAGIQHLLDHQPLTTNKPTTSKPANKTTNRKGSKMKHVFTAAATAAALCALAGCYIGKAEFKGEDMKMYPFFGTTAAPIE